MKLLISKKYVLIDSVDFNKISSYSWYLRPYYRSKTKFKVATATKPIIYMHRLIMNCPDELVIDHINGNALDNRKRNLRVCSVSNNAKNRSKNKNNTSGHTGVHWCKKNNKWKSRIRCDKKSYHLGFYTNVLDAAKAYNKKSLELFKEFSNLNRVKY